MNKTTSFDNILISFGRPVNESEHEVDNEINNYEFIKQPGELPGGGLRAQITLSVNEISLGQLIKDFGGYTGLGSLLMCKEGALVIAAVLTVSLDLLSIKSFPDEYSELLALIKKTPRGSTLNWQKIDELLQQPQATELLDALVEQQFLAKKSDGRYIVKKKMLIHSDCRFE